MAKLRLLAACGTVFAGLIVFLEPAFAITRTWVSASLGDDGNINCTRIVPCRTLQGALAVTDPGGVITVLETGDYSFVAIDKSVTIDGAGNHATITNFGVVGVSVNAANARVVLRDLDIDGGLSNRGWAGIHFSQGASLTVENVTIRNQLVNLASGVLFEPGAGDSTLYLRNVSISNSGAGSGGGVVVRPTGSGTKRVVVENSALAENSRGIVVQGGGKVQLSISNSTISHSTGDGILIGTTANATQVTIKDSQVVNNTGTGVLLAPTGSAKVDAAVVGSTADNNFIGIRSFPGASASTTLSISDTSASGNKGGIHASGNSVVGMIRGNVSGNSVYGITAVSPAAVRIGSSMVNGNTLGLSGPVSSYGNNQLLGNTTQGSNTPVGLQGIP